MATQTAMLMTADSLTVNINRAKDIFIQQMLDEGEINQQQYDSMKKYAIVAAKRGFLGKLWDSVFKGGDDDSIRIFVVKVLDPS